MEINVHEGEVMSKLYGARHLNCASQCSPEGITYHTRMMLANELCRKVMKFEQYCKDCADGLDYMDSETTTTVQMYGEQDRRLGTLLRV